MAKRKKKKIKQSKSDLLNHLQDHISFLSLSAKSFDQGVEGEAKRIAVSLRVLLHDTSQSHSLFKQLGQKISFFNTANKYAPDNLLSHHGLTALRVGNNESKHIAPLADRHKDKPLKQSFFHDWWNEAVIVDKHKKKFRRRDLVLVLANQDGGAHVDPGLDEAYSRLSRENSVGWVTNVGGKEAPVRPVELASVRQICYEVLYTLKLKFPEFFTEDMTL